MKRKFLCLLLGFMLALSVFPCAVLSAMIQEDPTAAARREPYANIVVPVTKNVKSAAVSDAPEATFYFELYDFGTDCDYNVSGDFVGTDGEGSYMVRLIVTVYSEEEFWNLSEGFSVREQTGRHDGWDCDTNEWRVLPGYEDNPTTYYNLSKGEEPYETETDYNGISFTNLYMGTGGENTETGENNDGVPNINGNVTGGDNDDETEENPYGYEYDDEDDGKDDTKDDSKDDGKDDTKDDSKDDGKDDTKDDSKDDDKDIINPEDIPVGKIYDLVYFTDIENKIYETETHPEYSNIKLTLIPIKEGNTFTGWYTDKKCKNPVTEVYMTEDITVYAGWTATEIPEMLNGEEHNSYVMGYEDGTVRPKNNITRAEVSMIFYRLLNEEVRNEYRTTENSFDDVPADEWYNEAISTMANLGILKGRTPTSFEPDSDITRAEYTAICSRFDKTAATGPNIFTDIDGHWAKDDVIHGVYLGWIKGYVDNTFRPDNNITRAEAMTLTNRVLQRNPETAEDLLAGMTVFPDNIESDWYYIAVQEAANGHEYERKENGHEKWTALK